MSQRLNIMILGGSGQIILNPEPPDSGLYDFGTIVTVLCIPDGGYTFVNWTVRSAVVGTQSEVEIHIGRSDISLVANLLGAKAPDFEYGLRLVSEYCTNMGKTRITIEDKNYAGPVTEMVIGDVVHSIGDFDSEPTELFVTSSLEWSYWIEDNLPDLKFLLTLDPRRFRVTYYRGYVNDSTYSYIWKGYLKTNFESRPLFNTRYKMSFVATDGISDMEGYKVFVPSIDRTNCMVVLAQLLNQTLKLGLPIRDCTRVFENRMNQADSDDVWTQFTINFDALYSNEDLYQEEGSVITFNPGKTVLNALKTILSCMVVRLYQNNGYWYIVRVQEYVKPSLKFIEFTNLGVFSQALVIPNDQEFDCLSNVVETGTNDYTEFNAVLNLGSINKPEDRQIIYDNFSVLSWYNPNPGRPSTNPAPGNKLKLWDYINAVVWDGVLESETARVERISNPSTGQQGDYVRIWCTAAGVADPLMSGLQYRSYLNNVAVKAAQVLSIQAKFQVVRRGSADTSIPPVGSHLAAIRVQIGSSYLTYDGDTTFSWSTDPNTLCVFPVETSGVFNIIDIRDIDVPEDGPVQLILCQLITVTGTRHRYKIDWEDVAVNLSRNDALAYKAVEAKSITDTPYSNVYPTRDTYIGDAYTNLSSSAIILKDEVASPVSESWNREDFPEETQKLLGITLQDLVNTYGKNNFVYSGDIKESEDGTLDFVKGLKFKGTRNILIAAKLDDFLATWNFQFYKLLDVSGPAILNWKLSDWDQESEFIDANMRIYVNEIQQVEVFESTEGFIEVNAGDTIRVQYFYLAGLYTGAPGVPRLNLIIDSVLTQSHTLDLNVSSTYNHTFVVGDSDIDVEVTSLDAEI